MGALGDICFSEGYYAYIGSALNGLEGRISRHLKTGKKNHWHIDYLLGKATVKSIVLAKTEKRIECGLAELFSEKFGRITDFGSSDCHCKSHLFYSENKGSLESTACEALKSQGLSPEIRRYEGEI